MCFSNITITHSVYQRKCDIVQLHMFEYDLYYTCMNNLTYLNISVYINTQINTYKSLV